MSLKKNNTTLSSTKGKSGTVGNQVVVDPLDPSQLDVSVVGWNNLEQKFNELKGLLSAPASGLNANQARAQQKQNVSAAIVQLLDRAQQDCRRLLIEGNAKAAVEGGLKTLRLKEAYYGHGHLQLVPSYFHLARTNQYMDKFKAAEEFLSLAQWTILRNKEVDVSLKAELHQTFGLLYASDSKLDAALKQLTCATYYLCCMNGPEHILTSFGYFDLGNVFAAKSNMEHAMAFYDKVKEIWYTHLTTALRKALEPSDADALYGTQQEQQAHQDMFVAANFGMENLQDAVKMLRGIVGLQTERYGRVHPSTARAEYVLGMFMLWNGDAVSAVGNLLKALEISKRVFGERHPNTGEIRSLMLNFGLQVPEDTSYVLEDGFDATAPVDTTVAAPHQAAPAVPASSATVHTPHPPPKAQQAVEPAAAPVVNAPAVVEPQPDASAQEENEAAQVEAPPVDEAQAQEAAEALYEANEDDIPIAGGAPQEEQAQEEQPFTSEDNQSANVTAEEQNEDSAIPDDE